MTPSRSARPLTGEASSDERAGAPMESAAPYCPARRRNVLRDSSSSGGIGPLVTSNSAVFGGAQIWRFLPSFRRGRCAQLQTQTCAGWTWSMRTTANADVRRLDLVDAHNCERRRAQTGLGRCAQLRTQTCADDSEGTDKNKLLCFPLPLCVRFCALGAVCVRSCAT